MFLYLFSRSKSKKRIQKEKAKISLEAITCRQRSTLGKGNAHEEGQNRGCSGSTELAIVVSRRSWREISLWKAGDRHKERKEEQKERNAGGNCARLYSIRGGNPRSLRISSNGVSFRGPHNHLDAELLQARWVLGAIDPEQFVELAVSALEHGFGGTALQQLAGLSRPP